MRNTPLCPSSRGRAGHLLLGVVAADGRVIFAPRPVSIDDAFVEEARTGRPLEQRFRFSSPCLRGGCDKWNGSACGVARVLREHTADVPAPTDKGNALPACAIRPRCRWHLEHGDAICFVCEWVVTERGNSDTEPTGPQGPAGGRDG